MTRAPTLEEILEALARASVGERGVAIAVPEEASDDDPLVTLALAFNLLMSDLEHRTAEKEAALREVARAEKLAALGALTSGLAHELRTPLAYIQTSLALVERRVERAAQTEPAVAALRDEVEEHLRHAYDGIERANRLVGDLRRYARTPPAEPSLLDLREVVAQAVDIFRASTQGRLEIRDELAPTPALPLERSRFQQVVFNLIQNAVEAMPQGGVVEVRTWGEDGEGVLEVADTGVGMPAQTRERLFEPFFTTKADGTGLGLAIVKRVVEEHGGEIEVHSEEGRGTRVRVRLRTRGAASA